MTALPFRKVGSFYEFFLDDYPTVKLGFVLDKLSVDGKYRDHPVDSDPERSWVWFYEEAIWPAVVLILRRSGFSLYEKEETKEIP